MQWGTESPIKYDDPKYKIPVALVAHGNFYYTLNKVRKFFEKVNRYSVLGKQFNQQVNQQNNQPKTDDTSAKL